MKKLFIVILMLTSFQAQASWMTQGSGYARFAAVSQQMASQLIKNSERAEVSLDLHYKTATPEFYLHYINRITQTYTAEGIYQLGYQYLCRKTRTQSRHYKTSTILCGELNHRMSYRPKTKKALL